MEQNLDMIRKISFGLQEFNQKVVFVGGTVIGFYITDQLATTPRPTIDVDCVIELKSWVEEQRLEE